MTLSLSSRVKFVHKLPDDLSKFVEVRRRRVCVEQDVGKRNRAYIGYVLYRTRWTMLSSFRWEAGVFARVRRVRMIVCTRVYADFFFFFFIILIFSVFTCFSWLAAV